MYNTILDICFPGVVVASLYRSFLAPILVSARFPQVIRSMLTCPLCFGFHVSWVWLVLRCLASSTAFGEHVSLLQWLTLPLLGGLFSYVLEHLITTLTNAERLLVVLEAQALTASTKTDVGADVDVAQVVEERRRR